MNFGLKLVDRYISNEFWQPLLFGVGIVTGVWFGADQLRTVFNLVMRAGVPWNIAFTILGLHMPQIIVLTIPIGVLLAILLVFNRLSAESEIIAIRTCGISFYRIMFAPLLFGIGSSIVSFAINEGIVPPANRTSKKLEFVAVYKSEMPGGQGNFTYMERAKDFTLQRIFYIGNYDGTTILNVIVLDFTRKNSIEIISAHDGIWHHGEWILRRGRTYVISGTSDVTKILKFDSLTLPGVQNAQKLLDEGKVEPKEMNMLELYHYINLLKASNSVSNDLLVHLYQKITQPLACLVVALAGAPLGLLGRRSRSNIGLIYSAVIVFLYYVLQSSSGALGEAGRIDPMLAAWMPNIVIGGLGLLILFFKGR